TIALLRGRVLDELAQTYPGFADQMRGDLDRAQAPAGLAS
ncbi:MAG: CoA synthetase, partial [Mesorhizobium sp.]